MRRKTYQNPFIQQELDSCIGVNDNDVVSIDLQPHFLNVVLPTGFLRLVLKPYDGSTDPNVFLSNYKFNLLNRGCKPIHVCKLFPEYLTSAAKAWFNELPAYCISNFRELGTVFLNRFFPEVHHLRNHS